MNIRTMTVTFCPFFCWSILMVHVSVYKSTIRVSHSSPSFDGHSQEFSVRIKTKLMKMDIFIRFHFASPSIWNDCVPPIMQNQTGLKSWNNRNVRRVPVTRELNWWDLRLSMNNLRWFRYLWFPQLKLSLSHVLSGTWIFGEVLLLVLLLNRFRQSNFGVFGQGKKENNLNKKKKYLIFVFRLGTPRAI